MSTLPIAVPAEFVSEFCVRNRIRKLPLFGSVWAPGELRGRVSGELVPERRNRHAADLSLDQAPQQERRIAGGAPAGVVRGVGEHEGTPALMAGDPVDCLLNRDERRQEFVPQIPNLPPEPRGECSSLPRISIRDHEHAHAHADLRRIAPRKMCASETEIHSSTSFLARRMYAASPRSRTCRASSRFSLGWRNRSFGWPDRR
jgi:hypothetical protein